MKKGIKHHFTHRDPEKNVPKEAASSGIKNTITSNPDLPFVTRDLVRTTLTIIGFVLLIAALYLIQTKTGILKPVLKLFGL